MKVLLVCTGNTCRSAMAALLMQEMAKERAGLPDLVVQSAGLAALPGEPPSAHAVAVLQEQNLNLSAHRAQPLTGEMLQDADLILTMTEGHRRAILASVPAVGQKLHTVKGYARRPGDSDIQDPFGCALDQYRSCAAELRDALEGVLNRILMENQ